jgi:hypothetical protein
MPSATTILQSLLRWRVALAALASTGETAPRPADTARVAPPLPASRRGAPERPRLNGSGRCTHRAYTGPR